jgi:hypothetical protein
MFTLGGKINMLFTLKTKHLLEIRAEQFLPGSEGVVRETEGVEGKGRGQGVEGRN